MKRNNLPRPLYREILIDALRTAWREKRLWPFAILAGVIQTGGIYDTFLLKLRDISTKSQLIQSGWDSLRFTNALSHLHWLDKVSLVEGLVFGGTLFLAIAALGIIAQGALVLGSDGHIELRRLSIRECLQRSAYRLIPLVILNAIMLVCLWIVTFITSLSLAHIVSDTTVWGVILYSFIFVLFAIGIVIFTSLQMFGLNGLMSDDLTLYEAIIHAYRIFLNSWLLVIETAISLAVIGAVTFIGTVGLSLLAAVPTFLFTQFAVILRLPMLYISMNLLSGLILFLGLILAGAFTVSFQYIAWNRLYRRINEGTAVAKIHRFYHWMHHHLST